MSKADTLAARQQFLGRNLSISYRDPVKIVRGSMQYLYDDEGREYHSRRDDGGGDNRPSRRMPGNRGAAA